MNLKDIISNSLRSSERVNSDSVVNAEFTDSLELASQFLIKTFQSKGKVLLAGNGGSAADSQHIAAEFIGRFEKERCSLPAISLTTDTSIITAISNDYSYDEIFSKQIMGIGKPGDIFFGLTTSGSSKNILKAFNAAKEKKIITVGLCGSSINQIDGKVDQLLSVPSSSTARIQECHIMILHIICSLVEDSY